MESREASSRVARASACGFFRRTNLKPASFGDHFSNTQLPKLHPFAQCAHSFHDFPVIKSGFFRWTGTSNAAAPYLAIVIVSPRATRLRRSEKRALASIALTVFITPSLREQVYNLSESILRRCSKYTVMLKNLTRPSSAGFRVCGNSAFLSSRGRPGDRGICFSSPNPRKIRFVWQTQAFGMTRCEFFRSHFSLLVLNQNGEKAAG